MSRSPSYTDSPPSSSASSHSSPSLDISPPYFLHNTSLDNTTPRRDERWAARFDLYMARRFPAGLEMQDSRSHLTASNRPSWERAQITFVVFGAVYVLFWLAMLLPADSRIPRRMLPGMYAALVVLSIMIAVVFRVWLKRRRGRLR